MSKYSLKTQAAYLFFGKIVAFFFAGISPIILVRLLTMDQYGFYRQILLVTTVTLMLMRLWIPHSLYYFFPREAGKLDQLISQTIVMLLCVGAAGIAIFLILGLVCNFLPEGITNGYTISIAIYLSLEIIACLIDYIFALEKKPRLAFLAISLNDFIKLAFIVGLFLFCKGIVGIIYALILHGAIRLVILAGYLVRHYVIQFKTIDRNLLKEQIKYIYPLALTVVFCAIGINFEKGIISAILSKKDFAIYSVGSVGVMSAVNLVYNSMGSVTMLRYGELAIEGKLDEIKKLWHKTIIINTMITIPLLCFCIIFAEKIITVLFTEEYILSANIWRVNLLIFLVQMLGYAYIPRALGRTREILIGNILRMVTVIVLSYFMITKIGLVGGAISFVLGFWINAIVQLYAGKKAIGATVKSFLPWKKLMFIFISSIIPATILYYIVTLDMSAIGCLIIGILYYFTVMAVLFKFFGYLDIAEFRTILRKN